MKIIFIQEEYGLRHWIGIIPEDVSIKSIIDWWESLQSVMGMFFNPSKGFPVSLYEAKDVAPEEAELCTWQWTDSKGTHILDRKEIVLFAHTHEDDDSYMKVVGGQYHYHAGYDSFDPDEETYEDEELPPMTNEEIEDLKLNYPQIYIAFKNNKII